MEWIPDIFLPFGFVAVGQDMRGTEKSQGNFSLFMSDSEDSEDIGNWIVQQDWSNGQIYTFGASADGIGSLQTPVHNPEWLKAQFLAWCPANLYKILFPSGAYKQKTTEDWIHGLEMPIPEVADDDIQLIHEEENGDTERFWGSVNVGPPIYKNVRAKNAFWGGWYDLFEVELLAAFEGYNTYSDPSVRGTSVLTVDPIGHCLEAQEFFHQNAPYGRTLLMLGQLFDIYGIRPVKRPQIQNVTFYVMSSNDEAGLSVGQYWTTAETFPKPVMTDFYFHG